MNADYADNLTFGTVKYIKIVNNSIVMFVVGVDNIRSSRRVIF